MVLLNDVSIIGIGSYLPGEPIDNNKLLDVCCKLHDPEEEGSREKTLKWIETKVGIETRHSCRTYPMVDNPKPRDGECNSDMCAKAIMNALECAGIDKEELDLIICATCTPDYPVPSNASMTQDKLGIEEVATMDVRSACCGSLQACCTAINYCRSGFYKTVVVVGCDVGSIFGNLDCNTPTYSSQDFVNAVMVGDGAGALIFRGFDEEEELQGIEVMFVGMNSIGLGKKPGMYLPLGGSLHPPTQENLDEGLGYFKHDYKAVLKHGAKLFIRCMEDALNSANLKISDIDMFVPHQANAQISKMSAAFGVPADRIYHNFERIGNTANASTLICLDEIAEQNLVEDGGYVLVGSAESTKWLYASLLLRWKNIKGNGNPVALKKKKNTLFRTLYSSFMFFLVTNLINASPIKLLVILSVFIIIILAIFYKLFF